jgi:hypothetical protein
MGHEAACVGIGIGSPSNPAIELSDPGVQPGQQLQALVAPVRGVRRQWECVQLVWVPEILAGDFRKFWPVLGMMVPALG